MKFFYNIRFLNSETMEATIVKDIVASNETEARKLASGEVSEEWFFSSAWRMRLV